MACADDETTSKKYTAIAGGVQAGGVQSMGQTSEFAVAGSFPGRMDWDTGQPKAGRLDGWIVLGSGGWSEHAEGLGAVRAHHQHRGPAGRLRQLIHPHAPRQQPVPLRRGGLPSIWTFEKPGPPSQAFGTFSSSASQAVGWASDGIRQSPRGDMVPPALTLGPLGSAERLNWLAKNRLMNTSSQCRIVARSYDVRRSSGKPGGHSPADVVVPGVPGQERDLARAGRRGGGRGRA